MAELQTQRVDLPGGGWVCLIAGFVPEHEACMRRLVEALPLRQESLVLFGKRHRTPRLTSWHGDPGCGYAYSGRRFEPLPWHPELSRLRESVVGASGYGFNGVLANYYRDGNDAMGAHSDDERELGPSRDDIGIGSLSLGARRRFLLGPKAKEDRERLEFALGEGDLLIMGGRTQQTHRHWVPRTAKPVGPRMNLTFRVVRPRGPGSSPE